MENAIEQAYERWVKKLGEVPDNKYDPEYKSKAAAEKRAYKKFADLCRSGGHNPITKAGELFDPKRYL